MAAVSDAGAAPVDGSGSGDAAARRLNNTRSSQLFETAVELPLTPGQQRMVLQLDFFKKWYLLCHAAYLMALVVMGSVVLFLSEPGLAPIDAFFIAMSTVCNCGLQTVDVGGWCGFSGVFRHLLMIGGGVVFTSAYQPLLRLLMLHRVWPVFRPNENDTAAEMRLRKDKEETARRLYHTSVIGAVTSFVYFTVVLGSVVVLLCCFNSSGLSTLDAFYMAVSSFHSCVFLSMVPFANDPVVVGLVTVSCALGFTAFPVVLRLFLTIEWRLYQLACKLVKAYRERRHGGGDNSDPLLEHMDEEEVIDLEAARVSEGTRRLARDAWNQGFVDILSSQHPGSFHPFLFLPAESTYLGAAWCALTLVQAIPFFFQHWHGLLADFSPAYRVYLALCQAGVVRFAAASFVPLFEYSNAHIAVTILAMYLPALPISTDRTYRKWKQMVTTSVVRLLTSRLFWLFTGMVSVLFAEEPDVAKRLLGTRFDIMTRTFFEVISAYSGCGLSLSVPGTSVSFIGCGGAFSKLVICAILFGGRHRFVDLGIDLGFSALTTHVGTQRPPQPPPP